MKRGQTHLLFVYILAGVIFVTVFIIGYKMISGLGEKQKTISSFSSVGKLKSDISSVGTQYGREEKRYYEIPDDVEEVCFYERKDNPAECDEDIDLGESASKSRVFIEDAGGKNVFMFGKSLEGNEEIKGFTLGCKEVVCFKNTNNQIFVTLEGTGDKAKIKNE